MTTLRKRAERGEVPGNVLTVQDAVAETILNSAGVEPKALAPAMGLPYRTVLDVADRLRARRLRADEVPRLINAIRALTGAPNYLVLDVMEQLVGRVAIPLPTVVVDRRDEFTHAMTAIREFSEQQAQFAAVIEDGVVTEVEASMYERQAGEAQAAIETLKRIVRAKALLATVPRATPAKALLRPDVMELGA